MAAAGTRVVPRAHTMVPTPTFFDGSREKGKKQNSKRRHRHAGAVMTGGFVRQHRVAGARRSHATENRVGRENY